MQINSSLYPYPVLCNDGDDYIDASTFNVEYDLIEATSFRLAQLKINFDLVDDFISQLVEQKNASIYLHVECPKTSYRDIIEVTDNKLLLDIDTKLFKDKVEFTAFILVNNELEGLQCKNVNEELWGPEYCFPKLSVGDPIAIDFTREVKIPESNNMSNVSSIMKIGKTSGDMMEVNYDNDVIFVLLPEEQFNMYIQFQSYGEMMFSSIIMPALIFVLEQMKSNDSEYSEHTWSKVISKVIVSLGVDRHDFICGKVSSIQLAQMILNKPYNRMFEQLKSEVDKYED